MEFDKNKILTVVTADQARVGQKGWFASNVETLSRLVLEEQPKELLGFDRNNAVHAFKTAFQNHALFYPAPEPTYAERQSQWVKENNVKAGTKVRVIRTFTSGEDGCNITFTSVKGTFIGDDCSVDAVREHDACITVRSKQKDDWGHFPYFVLDVVKEPTYRPFKNAEEFKPFRDEWFRVKNGCGFDSVRYYDNDGVKDSTGNFITYQKLFEAGERENGEPCGVREEA